MWSLKDWHGLSVPLHPKKESRAGSLSPRMTKNLQALHTQGLSMLTHNHWNIIYHLCCHHTTKLETTLLIFISSGVQGFSNITFYSTSPRPPSATCISRQAPSNLAIQMKNGVLGKGLCSVTEQHVLPVAAWPILSCARQHACSEPAPKNRRERAGLLTLQYFSSTLAASAAASKYSTGKTERRLNSLCIKMLEKS